jgi:hypothetical protein
VILKETTNEIINTSDSISGLQSKFKSIPQELLEIFEKKGTDLFFMIFLNQHLLPIQ